MRNFLVSMIGVSFLGAAAVGCCNDDQAFLRVHVVDGETGSQIQHPAVSADGVSLYCEDSTLGYLDVPLPVDDGGMVAPPPTGTDASVSPPPSSTFCQTYAVVTGAGFHTVDVTASGYFPTSIQVDMGDSGSSLSCATAQPVETTIAIYRKP